MGKVLLDISISIDGIMASKDNYRLHRWYFSENDRIATQIVNELIETTGAVIMGRNTFALGHEFDGFVNNPYQVPHIILTHAVPPFTPRGDT
jgi:dihydrofolate reductase